MALAAPAANKERTLHIERTFEAPLDRVYSAFTDPKLLARWFGPEGVTCPVCEIDLRVGGRWRACMRMQSGHMWVSGVYREIDRPRRLAFTWAWEENGKRGHETLVEIDFAATGPHTRILLTQREFETAESRGNHKIGWDSTFVCLDKFLGGM